MNSDTTFALNPSFKVSAARARAGVMVRVYSSRNA
jgi:hypothetical protein